MDPKLDKSNRNETKKYPPTLIILTFPVLNLTIKK